MGSGLRILLCSVTQISCLLTSMAVAALVEEAFDASAGEAEHSFQKGLEGATESSRASALAFPTSRGASPSTIVSLQLPIAGKRY